MRYDKDIYNKTNIRTLFRVKLIINFLFIANSAAAAIFSFKRFSNSN